ncbi:hypothetical protein MB02_10460 [Croceicoccus estronivorus]|uniref:cytochrome P450 n=1 Tax=Croceicoccus estronivorus TaxID=1172626 RepID=UPI000829B84B|nr:cytochrome P450 [Croceicoccus estronivorus]OCC23587.1 hypothetical protein MB02_10460 [Croceicoccus estronivorus]
MSATNPLLPEIDFARDDLPDLHDVLEDLRREGPVVSVNYHGAPVWLILGYEELQQAFLDQDHFDMGEGYRQMVEEPLGRNIMTMSGAEHRLHRNIVTAPFQPGVIRSHIEPLIEPVAMEISDRIAAEREVDLVAAFTRPYPFSIITRMLGIPVRDEERFLEWAVKLFDFPWDPQGAMRAKAQFDSYMVPIIEERRAAPGEDMLSALTQAESEGRRLDNEQVLTFLRLLFPAGSDTTFKVAGSMFAAVLSDPAVRDVALSGKAGREAVVAEALRWQPPTALLPRMASADVDFAGKPIRRGDWMLFGITAANSDPKKFPDPRRFDPSRNNRDTITFGRGPHFCLGLHLAKRELEIALQVVLERFPQMALVPGRPVEFVSGVLRGPRDLWVWPYGEK